MQDTQQITQNVSNQPQAFKNLLRYEQQSWPSSSNTSRAGSTTLTFNFKEIIMSPSTTLWLPISNGGEIAATDATSNTTALYRSFNFCDKRYLNGRKSPFTMVKLTSNEVVLKSQYSQQINNLIYYKDNSSIPTKTPSLSIGANQIPKQSIYLDPLLIHDKKNKMFNVEDDERNDNELYDTFNHFGEIDNNSIKTYLPIPMKMLLPALFEFQEVMFLTNVSLDIDFGPDPTFDCYEIINQSNPIAGEAGAQNEKNYVRLQPFKLIDNVQARIYSHHNTLNLPSYMMKNRITIQDKTFDLVSLEQTISFYSTKFFVLMILKNNAAQLNNEIGDDFFQIPNIAIQLTSFEFGGKTVYLNKQNDAWGTLAQQRAFESIMGFQLHQPHLAFFTFEELNSETKIEFSLKSGVEVNQTYKVLIYYCQVN